MKINYYHIILIFLTILNFKIQKKILFILKIFINSKTISSRKT